MSRRLLHPPIAEPILMIAAATVALLFVGVAGMQVASGQVAGGQVAGGQVADGQVAYGQVADGQVANGRANQGPRLEAARVGVELPATDTVKPRRRAVRLSEAYHTRLRIHKAASYAMLPLFAAQYVAGDQLFTKGSDAASWARSSHGVLAGGVAGLFTINTITGGLNWWETRGQESGRTWRTVHAALMLAAEAGFTVTGLLAENAEESGDDRRLHRAIAISSMSLATASYLLMLKPLRRD